MMKRYLLLFLIMFPFLLGAQSLEKLIEKGEYDKAIDYCVKRLEDGRGNKDKLYPSLKRAYEEANRLDLERVIELKSKGMPEIWFDVFLAYSDLQKRYLTLARIEEKLQQDQVNINPVNFTKDLEASRNNAVAYLYAHSVSLIKKGTKEDAAQASIELFMITKLYSEYKDVEVLLRQALGGSSELALLEIRNLSDASLPPDFISNMEDFALTYREKKYLSYVTKSEPGQDYSLIIAINITEVNVAPGTVSEKEYTTSHKDPDSFSSSYTDESKRIEDKKHPDYNKCKIKEIHQLKTAVMKGNVRYIDGKSGKVLYIVPLTARSLFENRTATASGDMFACPPEIYELIDKPKKKFPKNADMIYKVGEEFKFLVKGIIWNDAFIND